MPSLQYSLNRIFLLYILLAGISFVNAQTIKHNADRELWEDPTIVSQNRLPARSHFYAHIADQSGFAHTPWESDDYLQLNGEWSFSLSDSPFFGPRNFHTENYDSKDWGTIAVPVNWSLNGYGYPNYVNMRADFIPENITVEIGDIPHATNTTGWYIKHFELPDDWS